VAAKYYHRWKTADRHVFWMECDTPEGPMKPFRDIAREVIPGFTDQSSDSDVKSHVWNWLLNDAPGEWLLILDNANDEAVYTAAKECIPINSQKGYVLTTSQTATLPAILGTVEAVPVLPLPITHARQLFHQAKLAEYEISDENLDGLLELLQYHPLAIRQAAAYLGKKKTPVEEYIKEMESGDNRFASWLGNLFADKDAGKLNSLIKVMSRTFEQLWKQRDWSPRLLAQVACLYRNEIPSSLLWDAEGGDADDKFSWERALDILKEYSLVADGSKDGTYSMPRVVHLAVRSWLEQEQKADRAFGLERATMLCASQFPIGNFDQWATCGALYPHAQVIVETHDKLATGGQAPAPNASTSNLHAQLLFRMAWYEWRRGQYDIALGHSEAASIIWAKGQDSLAEKDASQAVRCLTLAGQIQHDHGNFPRAKQIYEEAIKMREKTMGTAVAARDVLTLDINHGLAMTLRSQYDFRGAEQLLRTVVGGYRYLQSLESSGGGDGAEALTARGNLAGVLLDQKRPGEAERELQSTLTAKAALLGAHDPSTLATMVHLAEALGALDRWPEAEAHLRTALGLYEDFDRQHPLGRHPDTVICLNQLAGALMMQCEEDRLAEGDEGRLAEASGLFGRVVDEYDRGVGGVGAQRNWQMVTALMNHAGALERLGDKVGLRARLERLLEWGLGFENPRGDTHRLDDAKEIYLWVFGVYKDKFGKADAGSLRCVELLRGLADSYWQAGRRKDSLMLKYLYW